MEHTLINWVRKAGASVLFLGYIPVAPGTFGAAVTIVGLWFARDKIGILFTPERLIWYWGIMLALIAVSMFLCARAKQVFGLDDPPEIVFDEVVGQFVTFFMIPLTFRTLLIGFLLFRFFDIVKPFPVHAMEEMEGGVGVTMDDVVAGVLANISLMAIMAGYHWVRAAL